MVAWATVRPQESGRAAMATEGLMVATGSGSTRSQPAGAGAQPLCCHPDGAAGQLAQAVGRTCRPSASWRIAAAG
jgi:hypothetical protein